MGLEFEDSLLGKEHLGLAEDMKGSSISVVQVCSSQEKETSSLAFKTLFSHQSLWNPRMQRRCLRG